MQQEKSASQRYQWRAFLVLWLGQAMSLLGSQVVQFAIIWYLTAETGSGTVLATSTLAGMLPAILLGPVAGTLVDRWPRRWVMLGADTFVALLTLLLAFLFASGQVALWHIYAVLFLRSIGEAFHRPAMQASTTLMVPPQHLTRVAGFNQMLQGGLNIVSAPLGALLVSYLRMEQIMLIDVVTALFAIVPLFFIVVPQPPARAVPAGADGVAAARPGVWTELKAGFRLVWEWPGLRMLIFIAVMLNLLLNPAFSLLPLLVTDHLQGAALQLGWLNAVFGVGTLLGGLLLGVWGGFRRRMATSLAGFIFLGLSTLLLGLTPAGTFWMALLAMLGIGLAIPIVNGPVNATMQVAVPPEMQGRVFTLLGSAAMAMSPLGLLVAGPLSDLVGVRIWYFTAGVACLLLAVLGASNQALMNLDQVTVGEVAAPGRGAAALEQEVI